MKYVKNRAFIGLAFLGVFGLLVMSQVSLPAVVAKSKASQQVRLVNGDPLAAPNSHSSTTYTDTGVPHVTIVLNKQSVLLVSLQQSLDAGGGLSANEGAACDWAFQLRDTATSNTTTFGYARVESPNDAPGGVSVPTSSMSAMIRRRPGTYEISLVSRTDGGPVGTAKGTVLSMMAMNMQF